METSTQAFEENDEKWQMEVRSKIEDLDSSKNVVEWNDWEAEFIENMAEKLEFSTIKVTPKQYEKICDLWEKI
jgi:hypothetical protein